MILGKPIWEYEPYVEVTSDNIMYINFKHSLDLNEFLNAAYNRCLNEDGILFNVIKAIVASKGYIISDAVEFQFVKNAVTSFTDPLNSKLVVFRVPVKLIEEKKEVYPKFI